MYCHFGRYRPFQVLWIFRWQTLFLDCHILQKMVLVPIFELFGNLRPYSAVPVNAISIFHSCELRPSFRPSDWHPLFSLSVFFCKTNKHGCQFLHRNASRSYTLLSLQAISLFRKCNVPRPLIGQKRDYVA